MCESQSSLVVVDIARLPERGWCLIHLSDGSKRRLLGRCAEEHGLRKGAEISPEDIEQIEHSCYYRACLDSARRLLKIRPRTEAELRRRFEQLRFPKNVFDRVIDELKDAGAVDDRAFATLWIAQRHQRFGIRRIREELLKKGISREIVEELVVDDYDRGEELKIADELVSRRLPRMKGLPVDVARRRLHGLLVRRGFDPEICSRIVERAIGRLGATK